MSKIVTRAELEAILNKVKGAEDADINCYDEGPFLAPNWRDMAALFAKVPAPPIGYQSESFDCDKFTRWTWAHVNAIWAKMCLDAGEGKPLPLAGGVLGGNVPLDGDNYEDGWHSLCWFVDENGQFWLYGAQERSVKAASAVDEIKQVDEFNVGG